MSRPYEGTFAHWVELQGVDLSIDELATRAAKDHKELSRKQLLQARYIARKRLGKVASRGHGPKPRGNGVAKAKPKANGRAREPEAHADDEGPPPKHTALRKLILDVGLEVAQNIFEEFRVISERMR